MEAVLFLLQRYIQAPRLGELGLRGAIIAFYVWAGSYLYRAWPTFSHAAPTQIKTVVYPLLVYAVFFWLMFMVFGPMLLAATGMRGAARRLGGFTLWSGIYVTRVTAMTLINLLVLIVRVGVAAISPGNPLQTCADAGTHFIERQADMIVWQLRR